MRRKNFMVRLTFRETIGELQIDHSDRHARTPEEAIQRAASALRSKKPRARIYGTAAYPYVVLR